MPGAVTFSLKFQDAYYINEAATLFLIEKISANSLRIILLK